jgi:hypothetical protein
MCHQSLYESSTDNDQVASSKVEAVVQLLPKGQHETKNSEYIFISAMIFKAQKVTYNLRFKTKSIFNVNKVQTGKSIFCFQ